MFEGGELQVRRRYRNMTPIELAPRWDKIVAKRAQMRREQRWDDAIVRSDKFRAYEKAHRKLLTTTFATKLPRLPIEVVSHFVSFAFHTGYY